LQYLSPCSGFVAIPGSNLGVAGGKDGTLYVLDRAALGGLTPGNTGAVQIVGFDASTASRASISANISAPGDTLAVGVWGSPVSWPSALGTFVYAW